MRNRNIRECNEPGKDVFSEKGIDKKLNNLLGFDDFEKTFKPKEQKSTKRTDVGLDILNEQISYLADDISVMPAVKDKINEIIDFVNDLSWRQNCSAPGM